MDFLTKKYLILLFANGLILMGLSSCCKSESVPFNVKLRAYLEKDLPFVNVSDNKFAAYFDFTGAMTACNNPSTDSTFNGLCQKITGNAEQFDIYKLGNAEITSLSGEVRPAEIFAQLKGASNKMEYYAPIEKTLKKITEEGRSAVLVTDFEEYTTEGQIYRQAYATPYFKKWLACGGDITFFVSDYIEGNLPKHLYYVVFDYNEHKLLELVKNGLQSLPTNYQTFILTANAYPTATNYLAASKGGTYHDENGDDIVSSSIEDGSPDGFFKIEDLRAESYCFGNSWEDIVENASYQTKENGVEIPFTHIFRNLFVDFSANNSYKIKSLDVRVQNVQSDFDKYWGYYEAMNNKPKIVKEAGETYLDFDGVEAGEQYYDETGNILPEFDYGKSPGNIIEVKDLLEFDKDLFQKTYSDDPSKVEIGVYLNKNTNGVILQQEDPNDLYRIDIIIANADICDQTIIEKLFGWPGNDCLSASIKSTLQDMKPVGKPIYSYFVRIQ